MSTYEADKEYRVTIDSVERVESAVKGTEGMEFRLMGEHGIIYHTMWFTGDPDNKERTLKTFGEFGITPADVRTPEFWGETGSGSYKQKLTDAAANITTKAEEHNGKTTVKIKWFNGTSRRSKASKKAPADLAAMFAGPSDDVSVPF